MKILGVNNDSFFVVRKKDSEQPFKGLQEIFGGLRNELPPGDHIKEFYAINSRTYTLKLASGRTISKAIGFHLNYKECALNFESFRKLVLDKFTGGQSEKYIKVKQRRRQKRVIKISDFSFSSNIAKKRRIYFSENELASIPWGYSKENLFQ